VSTPYLISPRCTLCKTTAFRPCDAQSGARSQLRESCSQPAQTRHMADVDTNQAKTGRCTCLFRSCKITTHLCARPQLGVRWIPICWKRLLSHHREIQALLGRNEMVIVLLAHIDLHPVDFAAKGILYSELSLVKRRKSAHAHSAQSGVPNPIESCAAVS
jgi:hypothetical protein